jgi:ribosome maturation factor RimP
VNRPLKKPGDFATRMGETVSITTVEPLDGRKHFKGKLTRLDDGVIGIEIDGRGFSVPLAAVKKAHVEYDFSRLKQPKKKHS